MAEFINSISEAINPHRLLLATVGIPLLTLFVTAYVSRRNTKLSAALKVAEMRQAWINTLRNHMVKYSALCLDHYTGQKGNIGNLANIDGHITLMMNWKDKDYKKLEVSMKVLLSTAMRLEGYKDKSIGDVHSEYITICQGILKREWNRLKIDIDEKRI